MDHVAHLCSLGDLLCILQSNLQAVILHIILRGNDFLLSIYQKIAGLSINLHMDIVSLSKMVLAGCHQGVLDGFKQGLLADLLLLLQNVQCLH